MKHVDYMQRAKNRNAILRRLSDTDDILNNPHILEDITIFI
jgi:hypothetical protein